MLNLLILYTCKKSAEYRIPFRLCTIIDERDDDRYSYLQGFINALCVNFMPSKLEIIPSFNMYSYLCNYIGEDYTKVVTDDAITKYQTYIKRIDAYFTDQQNQGHSIYNQPALYNMLFGVSLLGNKINLDFTTLTEDIVLYSIKYADNHGYNAFPVKVIQVTPYYPLVQAYGFIEGTRLIVKEKFNIEMTPNCINIISIDKDYLICLDENMLSIKYSHQNMYIDDVFKAIIINLSVKK